MEKKKKKKKNTEDVARITIHCVIKIREETFSLPNLINFYVSINQKNNDDFLFF